jgi:cbb3-type cytochrome oxidase maturation protein
MSVLFVLVPVALILVGAALLAFRWAALRGQFDDLTTPALRVLGEDGGLETDTTTIGRHDGPAGLTPRAISRELTRGARAPAARSRGPRGTR